MIEELETHPLDIGIRFSNKFLQRWKTCCVEEGLEVADQWAVMDLARGMAWRDGMIMWFMTFFFKMA